MLVSGRVYTSTDYNSCYQALSPFLLLRSFEILQKNRRWLTVNVPLFPKKAKRYSKILHSRKSWKTWGSWYITILYDQPKPCTISLQEQIPFKIRHIFASSLIPHQNKKGGIWQGLPGSNHGAKSESKLPIKFSLSCLRNAPWKDRNFLRPPILPRRTCHVTIFNLFVGHFGRESCYNQKHHHRNGSLEPPEINTTLACKRF